jgi:SAM-dependent methyltransferase
LCRQRLAREPHRHLAFIQADAGNTGLRQGFWDLVVAADLIEHLYPGDTLAVYREARRLLRPGGRLVVWTPNPGHLLEKLRASGVLRPDPTHVDYKDLPRVVSELRSEGFTIATARHVPSHLPVLRSLERLAQSFVPVLRRRVAVVAFRT